MDKKALIVVTSHNRLGDTDQQTGWHLAEVTHIYFPLKEAGFAVDFASPKGGVAEMDENSRDLDDKLNQKFLDNKERVNKLKSTIPLKEINPNHYHLIHFAGGHGTMWDFPANEDINRITSTLYENGGVVAAICHGPAALVNVTLSNGQFLIDGKDICSFTNAEEKETGKDNVVPFLLETKLKERGAHFKGGENWENNVVVSDRLVTGQNPQSATSLGKKMIEVFKNQE